MASRIRRRVFAYSKTELSRHLILHDPRVDVIDLYLVQLSRLQNED